MTFYKLEIGREKKLSKEATQMIGSQSPARKTQATNELADVLPTYM